MRFGECGLPRRKERMSMNEDWRKRLKLPIGTEFFEKIRKAGAYYVDKTGFIPQLLYGESEVTLFTRPRRFGKTLTMTMLHSFFDITRDSKEVFKGLKISQYPEVCAEWMNQYPTIFLTLKEVEGATFDIAFIELSSLIARVCLNHDYLKQSKKVKPEDLEVFKRLCSKKGTPEEVTSSLLLLSNMLFAHWGKKPIILMDEYDVPLAKANARGYYKEMVDAIRALMNKAFKSNNNLNRAFLTGCLRVSKESIFTGLNNLKIDTISNKEFAEFIGFSQAEVDQLLKDAKLSQCAESVKCWYDGYIFGSSEMYCPWDMMNYVSELQVDPQTPPRGYWKNTSSNDILTRFFEKGASDDAREKFETLLAGGKINVDVTEEITYGTLEDNEDNFWSLLYLTGYLTKADKTPMDGNNLDLRIPNAEIKDLFKTTIIGSFKAKVRVNHDDLFNAFWKGNAAVANEEVGKLLRASISYYDSKERSEERRVGKECR